VEVGFWISKKKKRNESQVKTSKQKVPTPPAPAAACGLNYYCLQTTDRRTQAEGEANNKGKHNPQHNSGTNQIHEHHHVPDPGASTFPRKKPPDANENNNSGNTKSAQDGDGGHRTS
jgi:hypothetical protein